MNWPEVLSEGFRLNENKKPPFLEAFKLLCWWRWWDGLNPNFHLARTIPSSFSRWDAFMDFSILVLRSFHFRSL